jgi:uncharacterized protein YbjT (DUF2867 family)
MHRRSLLAAAFAVAVSVAAPAFAADKTAIVFGANGRLGSENVKALVAAGYKVTAFVRPTSDRSLLAGVPVTYAEGDARNAADVDKAMTSADFAVAINTIARRSRAEVGVYDSTQNNITAAAKAHGVDHVIFFSSVGVGDSRGAYTDKAYANFKTVMEERDIAEKALVASGLTYTIIRTGGVVDEPKGGTGKAYLTEDRMSLGGATRPDLARLALDCIGAAKCLNKTFAAADDTLTVPTE